jgi:hypothetical protein
MQKDFSISTWSTSTAVTIKEVSTGKASAKHWLYGDPIEAPVLEECSASATIFNFSGT